ncbi:MAG TPA: hypothetical protein VGJ94_10830 [Syntrophorhabdaceae bacterium]|jgi:hypothetical protein
MKPLFLLPLWVFPGLVTALFIFTSPAGAAPGTQSQGKCAKSAQISIYNPAGVLEDNTYVDEMLKKRMVESGKTKPLLAGNFPKTKIEEVCIKADAVAEINDLFYKRGWSDGLPLVPPTAERVKAMLKGSDLDPGYVISKIDPVGGQATVEKIAVNAVMAGCRPEYMPVLLAAVEAVMDPGVNLRGMATTTSPDVPLLIVNGPIAKQLDINSGSNALGRGSRANSSISRALNLIIQNVGGSWVNVTDMSTLGQAADFSSMLAESDESPWEPLHADLDFPKNTNVVTVVGVEPYHTIMGLGHSPDGFMRIIADHLIASDRPYQATMVLLITKDTANMMARNGWTKDKIRDYIDKNARAPLAVIKEKFLDNGTAAVLGGIPSWVKETKDLKTMIPAPFIGQLHIIVAGGTGEKSALFPGWLGSKSASRKIRLPSNWDELREAAR